MDVISKAFNGGGEKGQFFSLFSYPAGKLVIPSLKSTVGPSKPRLYTTRFIGLQFLYTKAYCRLTPKVTTITIDKLCGFRHPNTELQA